MFGQTNGGLDPSHPELEDWSSDVQICDCALFCRCSGLCRAANDADVTARARHREGGRHASSDTFHGAARRDRRAAGRASRTYDRAGDNE